MGQGADRGRGALSWWRGLPGKGPASVFHVDLSPDPLAESAAWDWLDEIERARWSEYVSETARRQFALCRAALRALVCRRLGCGNDALQLAVSERGKPHAVIGGKPNPISFNVSHSGAHGLVAIAAGGMLGVDLEVRAPRRTLATLIGTVLTESEKAQLESLDERGRLGRFYELWTAKEALVKATGIGHALDFAELDMAGAVGRPGQSCRYRCDAYPEVDWEVSNLGSAAFAAAMVRELPD